MSPQKPKTIIILAGPTAIGKTELSLTLAGEVGCEIVSMDSMQIYKYMDIGTAKPSAAERALVPHHLVDYVDPAEDYSVARFVDDANVAVSAIIDRGNTPLFVGGTGLFMKGFVEGVFDVAHIPDQVREKVRREISENGNEMAHARLAEVDPEAAARIHINDSQRIGRGLEVFDATGIAWSDHLKQQIRKEPAFDFIKIGLNRPREELYDRINLRVDVMVEQGILAETHKLLAMGYDQGLNSMQSIGYRHMLNFINSKWDWSQTLELLARDTRRYAKRQLTWFNKDHGIDWFKPTEIKPVVDLIKNRLLLSS